MSNVARLPAPLLAALVLVVVPALALAHEVTHNGTVVALKTARYAQPAGGTRDVRELEVAVVDPKTKKVANRVFTITDKTKITRAGKPVAVADATAQPDETVAVVVDHDKPGDEAIQVRFDAALPPTLPRLSVGIEAAEDRDFLWLGVWDDCRTWLVQKAA